MHEDDSGEGRRSPVDPETISRTSRWGEVLKHEAGSRGLMAEALADRTGLSEERVRQVLDEPSRLTLQELELLTSVLPIDLGVLIRMVLSYRTPDEPQPSLKAWIIQHLSGHGE